MKTRHKGRYPKHDKVAWSSLNSVLGGSRGVSLQDVATAVNVSVESLSSGRKRWDRWLDIEHDNEGVGKAYLQDVQTQLHGNHWPVEWTNHILSMWEDERVTRKGEGMGDYVHDPKFRKGRAEPHVVHYIEMKMHEIQEVMQSTGEAKFGPDFVYLDGKTRVGFPKRPKKGREKHGGGIGKKMKLLMPFFVKRKGRNLCLCWRHLEWEYLTEGLFLWRKANRQSNRGAPPAVGPTCKCENVRDPYQMRKNLMCPRRERLEADLDTLPVLGVDFDNKACIERTCQECAGVRRLEICAVELAVKREITYMKRVQIEYVRNDGTKKKKYDFVRRSDNIQDFLSHMETRLADLAPHHADMVWQRRDWVHMQKNFPKGTFIYVSDFSENLTLEVQFLPHLPSRHLSFLPALSPTSCARLTTHSYRTLRFQMAGQK